MIELMRYDTFNGVTYVMEADGLTMVIRPYAENVTVITEFRNPMRELLKEILKDFREALEISEEFERYILEYTTAEDLEGLIHMENVTPASFLEWLKKGL